MTEQAGSPLVLVVEDDQSAREMYMEALALAGYRAAEAHNGLQALEKIQQLQPSAVVTDLAIPGIDGFQLCRELQHRDGLSKIPVLAITGRFMDASDMERALQAGCRAVLLKPFPPEEFIEAVHTILGSNGPIS